MALWIQINSIVKTGGGVIRRNRRQDKDKIEADVHGTMTCLEKRKSTNFSEMLFLRRCK